MSKSCESQTPKEQGPPDDYGPSDGNVIFETIDSSVWIWHARNEEAYIFYDGPTMELDE